MKNRQFLTFSLLFLVAFVSLPNLVSAKDEWRQVRSKNFYLIGNASEKDIRKVATRLEQFRETFRQLFTQTNLNSLIPTNVVVFKNSGAYKPFKPKRADGKTDDFIAGYFQSGEDVNYITLSAEGEEADTYGTIFHEYVHFIINANFGKSEVPPWFNEGLAEYYQTFAIEQDQKVKLGLPQTNHLLLLQQNKLIPLDTLFKISNYTLHQNENHSRSIFYAQSWALIHYLIQSGKTEGLGKFLNFALKDTPAEKSFQEAFQTSYAQMEKDLKKYVAQNSYKYSLVTFKNKLLFDGEMQTSLMSEAETNAYLGDLLYHTNRADDAEAYLQKAIALAPDSSMANTTFGMVKMRQKKYNEAKIYLEKAMSEDQKNHLAFYRYAYLLSIEDRDEFGYVSSFPQKKAAKMRELLKKAIAINPRFTESYELLAFVSLVNNEQFAEAISSLQTALKYQPGNQRYAMRIAEIFMRQDKFTEAAEIADKIAKTTDEPETKLRAENLARQIRERQEMLATRQQYNASVAEANKNGSQPILIRREFSGKKPSPEELAKAEEESIMRSINQAIRKAAADEKQVIGQIQKIECKGKIIIYTVKTNDETFTLSSKDFESLTLMTFVADADGVQVGCGENIAAINAVLTYKPPADANNVNRGELTAVDFVPKNFRFVDTSKEEIYYTDEETAPPMKTEDLDKARRTAMMQAVKNTMRQPQTGEKRELGFIEKVECNKKGMFFYFKTQSNTLKLAAVSPQASQIRAFTPEVEQIKFGCGLKQIDVPVVFTYKENLDPKADSNGEIIALEFVPKGFILESQNVER